LIPKSLSRLKDPKGNQGSDLLLITMLNARWLERYGQRSESKDERGKEALEEIRQMNREWKKKLELEAVEGELSEEGG